MAFLKGKKKIFFFSLSWSDAGLITHCLYSYMYVFSLIQNLFPFRSRRCKRELGRLHKGSEGDQRYKQMEHPRGVAARAHAGVLQVLLR